MILTITTILMSLGLIGIILPVLAGLPYMWILALVYAAIGGFSAITPTDLGWLGLITAASIAVDYLGGILGAKLGGASLTSLGYGALGMIVGTIIAPPLGGMIGMFVAIATSELYHQKDRSHAVKAASGGVIGSIAAISVNLILGIGFILLFLYFATK